MKTLRKLWIVLFLVSLVLPVAAQDAPWRERAKKEPKDYKAEDFGWDNMYEEINYPEPPKPEPPPPPQPPMRPGEYVEPEPEPQPDPADLLTTDPTVKVYSFGERATVRCAPRLACTIDLEPGERIRGRAIGDPDRWDYSELVSGPDGAEQAHLVVRPTDYGIHTNLIVTTDRRAYRIQLVSETYPEKPEKETVAFTEQVAFRYPKRWVEEKPPLPKPPEPPPKVEEEEATPVVLEPASLEKMNFAYKVVQPKWKRHRFDWKPLAVFDDGQRTYVQLPPLREMDLAPIIRGIQPTGEPYPLNAMLHGQTFVIPKLVKRAEILFGVGKNRKWLRIERLN